ncbi:MAG: HEAT repeat domain-containing protein [Gemmataceae bacterium]
MKLPKTQWCAVVLICIGGQLAFGQTTDDSTLKSDEATLRDAGLQTDGAALLDFFRQRTLSEQDMKRLAGLVRLMGDESYAVREKAQSDLIKAGGACRKLLEEAMRSTDLEIARRAERCLEQLQGNAGVALTLSATRLMAHRKPEGATRVLLDYLPFAGNELDGDSIEDEVVHTLEIVGMADSKTNNALTDALTDKLPIRRAAAALVLGRSPRFEDRGRVKSLLDDADPKVRLRAAQGLIHSREKEGVKVLVGLLEKDAPMNLAWQAEEMLARLAGTDSPRETLGGGSDAERKKCHDAWLSWWNAQGKNIDLAKINLDERTLGLTLIIVYDGANGGQGQLREIGPDHQVRWNMDRDLRGPIDAQVLSGNRVLIAEYNGHRITERDMSGKILWEHQVNGNPVAVQRLPNGNTFVATLNQVLEVRRDKTTVYSHMVPGSQITYAQKLRNGNIAHISTNGFLVEMDEAGKEKKRTRVGGNTTEWLTFETLPGNRFLVPQQRNNRISEYDSAGKEVFGVEVNNQAPYSAVKLSNGHYIACSMNRSMVYEVDRSGKVIWEERLPGRPFRVRRR